jgi:DNA-directed RNA polymerase specialized sigma24 family protein
MLACSMVMQTTALAPIEKLVELYYPPLFRFATRLCGNPAKAMVLTQRTFRLAFDFSRTLPVPTNVRAWLFAVMFNKFLEGRARILRA